MYVGGNRRWVLLNGGGGEGGGGEGGGCCACGGEKVLPISGLISDLFISLINPISSRWLVTVCTIHLVLFKQCSMLSSAFRFMHDW